MKSLALMILVLASCAAAQSSRDDSIPPGLIGKWYASQMSNTQYSDRATGENNTASGSNASFEFRSDGSFVYVTFSRVQVYGCITTIYNYNPGGFKIEGNRVIFIPTDDELIYKSSCNPSLNSDKHTAPQRSSFKFTFKTEEGIRYLCFTDDSNKEGCWRKLED